MSEITIDWRGSLHARHKDPPDDPHSLRIDLGHDSLSSIRSVAARKGQRCGSCRFLDRCEEDWRCANLVRVLILRTPLFIKAAGVITHGMRLLALRPGTDFGEPYRQLFVNPGWFACPLWLPGESMSVRAWREGRYGEFLALLALAGEPEERTEFRTHRDSQARLDPAVLERYDARLTSARKQAWLNRLLDGFVGPMYSFGAACTAAAKTFGGLAELVTTKQLVSDEGAFVELERPNCRCTIDYEAEDET